MSEISIVRDAEKLPPSLRGKWEKEIAKYSEKNGDEYPAFHIFSKVIQRHSRIKNNLNILAGTTHTPTTTLTSPFSAKPQEEKTKRLDFAIAAYLKVTRPATV